MIDVRAAAERLNALNRKETAAREARKHEADKEGRRLALLLGRSDGQVRRVWGFGSAFETDRPFRLDSDIDLAVEGGDYPALCRIVEGSSFAVDLIDLSGRNDPFAALIRERGVLLYTCAPPARSATGGRAIRG